MAGNRLGLHKLRVGAEGPHKRSPGKLSGCQCANNTIWRRIKSLDIGNMGSQLPLQKIPALPSERGGLDLFGSPGRTYEKNRDEPQQPRTSFAHEVQASI